MTNTNGENEKHTNHEEATKLLHHVNNHVQIVLGWIELGDMAKAKIGVRELIKLLSKLAKSLARAPKNKKA